MNYAMMKTQTNTISANERRKKMKIRLFNLKLKNFKGIKDFELDSQGKNVRIYGDNATGKTTLADAWHWLLFDKDSRGQSNFEIKTLDDNNQPIHNLEHEVEGTLEVDGQELTLKKVYYEKWTKKRGSATETFSGHTTDYYIDDVPVKKSEYDARIAEIINENIFKMLTSPSYFNEQLHWEDRREILIEVCGDVSDEDVISSDKKLGRLTDTLGKHSIDDHKKSVKAKQKKINDELKKIPVRIDEVNRGLPDVSNISETKVSDDINSLKGAKAEREQTLARVESGGEIAEKKKSLAEIETELIEIQNNHSTQYKLQIEELENIISADKAGIRGVEEDIKSKQYDIKYNSSLIEQIENGKKQLKERWYKLQEEKDKLTNREWDGNTICPTCGQELPEEQIEEAKANFNRNKAERIEKITKEQADITKEGQLDNEGIEDLKSKNKIIEGDIEKLETHKKELQGRIDKRNAELSELEQKARAYQESFQYKKKLTERTAIEQSIEKLKEGISEEIATVKQDIRGLENQIVILEQRINMIERYKQGQERIQELSEQEKELAKEYEQLEKEIYLCEEFTRAKVDMLTEKINSKFELARFKLFEEQINGGLNECCETLVNGVPHGTNLNSGAKLNVGIDIINTLSKHYDFYAPIFVDNSESVTEIAKSVSQMIKLVVSEQDKKLRIEIEKENKKIKEAV
jgi:DNA repair exonuclease SbcCD ATPase subunit